MIVASYIPLSHDRMPLALVKILTNLAVSSVVPCLLVQGGVQKRDKTVRSCSVLL